VRVISKLCRLALKLDSIGRDFFFPKDLCSAFIRRYFPIRTDFFGPLDYNSLNKKDFYSESNGG
jgi:hypothetical protein